MDGADGFQAQDKNVYLSFLKRYRSVSNGQMLETRSGTTYTVSDAYDLLETALNETYCRPSGDYDSLQSKLDTFTVPLSSQGLIEEDTLLDRMSQMANTAGDFYHGLSETTKEPLMFVLDAVDTSSSGSISISSSLVVGLGVIDTSLLSHGPDDYWEYCWKTGKCGTYQGQGEGMDATDILDARLRSNKGYKQQTGNQKFFKRDIIYCITTNDGCSSTGINFLTADDYVDFRDDHINESDPISNDNYYGYLQFYNYSGNPNYHTCLEPDEIDFYTRGMEDIIEEYQPVNRAVGLIDVGCNALYAYSTTIHHAMLVVYVELVSPSTTDPVDPLPCSIC